MKGKHVSLLAVFIAGAAAVYFFKDRIWDQGPHSLWDFVPESAFGVWETDQPVAVWNEYIKTDHWQNFSNLPVLGNIDRTLDFLDSLTGNSGFLDRVSQSGAFLLSLHTTSRSSFDFVCYLDLSDPSNHDEFLKFVENLHSDDSYRFIERIYHATVIVEVMKEDGSSIASYLVDENTLIVSPTAFLIEDVIRTIGGETSRFIETNGKSFGLTGLEFDAGNFYMNLDHLSEFASIFISDKNNPLIEFSRSLVGSAFLDIDFDEQYLYLNGFFLPGDSTFLEIFRDQKPASINYSKLIPENAAQVFVQSFSNVERWYAALREYNSKMDPLYATVLMQFQDTYDFEVDRSMDWITEHVVHVLMEPVGLESSRLLLIGSNDVHESLNQLNALARKANDLNRDTLYFEYYSEQAIGLLNINELPGMLFGPWYQGYPSSYYTIIENFVILSDDIETIKNLINDREEEYTWRQSLNKTEFLNKNLEESNLSLFINVHRSWNLLTSVMEARWNESLTDWARELQQVELLGFQIGNLGNKNNFYLSATLKSRKVLPPVRYSNKEMETSWELAMDTAIFSKPKVVRNHQSSDLEVLVQTLDNKVHLLGSNGEIIWSRDLGNPTAGEWSQIDFFKNRNLQYLLATDSSIFVIDRNGEGIDGYPIEISDIDVDEIKVIDYDRSRNYRWMLIEENGDVYLMDKEGNMLEGWNPRSYDGRFAVSPFHLRVRSKDLFVAILENGVVDVTNRRGEMVEGFPLKLDARIQGEVFSQVKSGLARTLITVISSEGELIQFNLEGGIVTRRQLYKPSRDTRFWIIKGALGKTFVIGRQDLNQLAVLDKEGNAKMEKDYLFRGEYDIQYYNFGSGRELILVRNAEPYNILAYDGKGRLITAPFAGDFPVSVMFYESRRQYDIYSAQGDRVFLFTLQNN